MHAHERTLLQRMGFQDPDRKRPEHDAACRYLSEPDQVQRLRKILRVADDLPAPAVEVERPVFAGKARILVGFVDIAMAWATIEKTWSGEPTGAGRGAIVEVKTSPVSGGDALRQLKLYREHAKLYDLIRDRCDYWRGPIRLVLATTYRLRGDESALLKREGVIHLRLASAFEEWLARDAGSDDSPEL